MSVYCLRSIPVVGRLFSLCPNYAVLPENFVEVRAQLSELTREQKNTEKRPVRTAWGR